MSQQERTNLGYLLGSFFFMPLMLWGTRFLAGWFSADLISLNCSSRAIRGACPSMPKLAGRTQHHLLQTVGTIALSWTTSFLPLHGFTISGG